MFVVAGKDIAFLRSLRVPLFLPVCLRVVSWHSIEFVDTERGSQTAGIRGFCPRLFGNRKQNDITERWDGSQTRGKIELYDVG